MIGRVPSLEPRLIECLFAMTEHGLMLVQERSDRVKRVVFCHRCDLRVPRSSSPTAFRTSQETIPGDNGLGRAENGIKIDLQMRQPGLEFRRGGQPLLGNFGNRGRRENRSFIKVRQLSVLWPLKCMDAAAEMNKKSRPKGQAHDTKRVVKVRA